jgi:hypothetical protein
MRKDGLTNAGIRHPATITEMKKPSPGKRLSATPIKYSGFDIETEPKTGEARLMYDSTGIKVFDAEDTNQERYEKLVSWLQKKAKKDFNIASWTQFDHTALFRIIIDALPPKEAEKAVMRFGRLNPAVATEDLEFHTFNNVQNIKVKVPGLDRPKAIMVVDAKRFFNLDLATTCKELGYHWYDKMEEEGKLSVHVVQWGKYQDPRYHRYRHRVRKSCKLDARAAANIIDRVQRDFNELFRYYPKLLSSTGGLAKAATAALLDHKEYKSLYFQDQLESWRKTEKPPGATNELWCMAHEAFSAGLIEAYRLGYHKKAWMADIASAYPSVIGRLCDLRGSTITKGTGEPPKVLPKPGGLIKDYVLIRGTLNVPQDTHHTIGYKNAMGNRMRPWGTFEATYNIHERSFAQEQGAKFSKEQWIHIKTKGEPHPLARVSKRFLAQRENVRKTNNGKWSSKETIPKIANNSLYGISYEHINNFMDDGESGTFQSHSTGELYNPLIAGYITALSRITLSMAIVEIEKAGGTPILAMTDSIHWIGTPEMLKRDIVGHGIQTGMRENKTLGYFETPEEKRDFYCFGTGRYEYRDPKTNQQKESILPFQDPEATLDLEDFYVKARSYFMKKQEGKKQTFHIAIKQELDRDYEDMKPYVIHSVKVTPGLVRGSHNLSPKDINRIYEDKKEINPFSIGMKRGIKPYKGSITSKGNYRRILKESIPTTQIYIEKAEDFDPIVRSHFKPMDNQMKKYREIFLKQIQEGENKITNTHKPPKKPRRKLTPEERKERDRERKRKAYRERKRRLEEARRKRNA